MIKERKRIWQMGKKNEEYFLLYEFCNIYEWIELLDNDRLSFFSTRRIPLLRFSALNKSWIYMQIHSWYPLASRIPSKRNLCWATSTTRHFSSSTDVASEVILSWTTRTVNLWVPWLFRTWTFDIVDVTFLRMSVLLLNCFNVSSNLCCVSSFVF